MRAEYSDDRVTGITRRLTDMKEIILIKHGELALKGLNRSTFEDVLAKNIRWRLKDLGNFKISRSQSTMTVEPLDDDADMDEAANRIGCIFGIAGYSRAGVAKKNLDSIRETAVEYLADELCAAKTFKVEAKRSDKKFPLTSPELSRETGAYILSKFPGLKVDVHNPDLTVTVEVRDGSVYVRGNQLKGAGGMPVGTAGRAMLLVSGGIDSPVAGWMMAKRGLFLDAVHFVSPPYTSTRAEMKVHELVRLVTAYSGRVKLTVVPFTKIQEHIKDNCPEDLFTLIMRRQMMKIACRLAHENGDGALITGESLGQVASQTLQALACTDKAADIPVFRPLIGMDKNEIVTISRKINTFDTSILPYEDCCTVFTPKHPKTKPTPEMLEAAEEGTDWEAMLEEAIEQSKTYTIG